MIASSRSGKGRLLFCRRAAPTGKLTLPQSTRSGQDRSLRTAAHGCLVGRGLDPSGQPGGGRRAVGAERLAAHSERRQPAKLARSCGCLPRGGKHCSLPGFAPLNRGPTLTTPQCPAPTARRPGNGCPRKPHSVSISPSVGRGAPTPPRPSAAAHSRATRRGRRPRRPAEACADALPRVTTRGDSRCRQPPRRGKDPSLQAEPLTSAHVTPRAGHARPLPRNNSTHLYTT